jgi:lipoyl(octanoyl) transferase
MILNIQDLGSDLNFQDTWRLQEDLVAQRRAGEIGDTLILLEHAPVYTIGRTRDQSSLKSSAQLPHPVVVINRGGEGTYHGPGQLVGYAILDLTIYKKDLHRHLRNLEEAIIRTIATFGVEAQRREGLTGVWIEERKIASLGVGVRSWVTLHGLALNVNEESLPPFQWITPCGIGGVRMTCLEKEVGSKISLSKVKQLLSQHLEEVLSQEILGNSVTTGPTDL